MCKNKTLLTDVIFHTLGEMFPTKTSQQAALKYPKAYNVEHLVEIALSKLGGYEFVDEEGYDFTDLSDSKTCSVNASDQSVVISSVENKIGALRIVVYNYHKKALDFLFVPKDCVRKECEPCYGKQQTKLKLRCRYNAKTDSYNKFEKYRVKDFETLAKLSG